MPFAPKIRKNILKALEESVLPTLQSRQVRTFLTEPPFDFLGIPRRMLRKDPLPDNDKGPLQVIRQWSEYQLVASRGFCISFLYEGVQHRRIGFSESHVEKMLGMGLTPPPGVQVLQLSAPFVYISSDFVAKNDGSPCPEQVGTHLRTLSISFDREDVHTFYSALGGESRISSHHLELKDLIILNLGNAYLDALRIRYNQQYAQAILLSIMFRLRYLLLHTRPTVGNSCWVDPVTQLKDPLTDTQLKHQSLCDEVIDYVQNNLHSSLTLISIASKFSISGPHLNRVFREVHGTTLMRYVTKLRIDVAKRMLIDNKERISDIAQLTGFASVTSLSHVFRRHIGVSPTKFRAKYKKR